MGYILLFQHVRLAEDFLLACSISSRISSLYVSDQSKTKNIAEKVTFSSSPLAFWLFC